MLMRMRARVAGGTENMAPKSTGAVAGAVRSAPPSASGRRAQRPAQELDERRARTVGDVEAQPLPATTRRGKERAAGEEDRARARRAHQLIHRRRIRDPAPEEHSIARGRLELDTGGLERGARVAPHACQALAR